MRLIRVNEEWEKKMGKEERMRKNKRRR